MKHIFKYRLCERCGLSSYRYYNLLNIEMMSKDYTYSKKVADITFPCLSDEEYIIKKALE